MRIGRCDILTLLRAQQRLDLVGPAKARLPARVDSHQHAVVLNRLGIDLESLLRSTGGPSLTDKLTSQPRPTPD